MQKIHQTMLLAATAISLLVHSSIQAADLAVPNTLPPSPLIRSADRQEPSETPHGEANDKGKPTPEIKTPPDTFTNSFGMIFKIIPAGTFTMGTAEFGLPHSVTISRQFYMQTTEVTQGQWKAVMGGNNPSKFSGCGDHCPVDSVSWNDVQGLITAMNHKGEGTYRLPTEAEWEYSARAGTTTVYSFGDSDSSLGNYGWYSANSSKTTHPVATKLPNPWGLYDMHGNVWEWGSDWWWTSYAAQAVTDPQGPSSGYSRLARGGSWFDGPLGVRSVVRVSFGPNSRFDDVGLRLLRVYP